MPELNDTSGKETVAVKASPIDYGNFLELAAHDLNAPLRKLGVLMDRFVIKYGKADSEAIQYTNRMHSCVVEMRSLIDDLKELAGNALVPTRYEPCDLDKIVKKYWHELEISHKDKNISLISDELPVIEADKAQCRQLIKQLLDNAYMFSKPETALEVIIQSTKLEREDKLSMELDEDKEWYRIEIRDNGVGFDQENAEKIFEPFVRMHSKSSFGGNGLGLAIAKRIVENHRGILYAEGMENVGARFIFILPDKH